VTSWEDSRNLDRGLASSIRKKPVSWGVVPVEVLRGKDLASLRIMRIFLGILVIAWFCWVWMVEMSCC